MAHVAVRDDDLRQAISEALRDDGWAVEDSPSGYHLLQAIDPSNRWLPWRSELIVADAFSPGCSGVSLAAGLRDLGWSSPIVLLVSSRAELERVSDDPENSIFVADRRTGVAIVREIAHRQLESVSWTPYERKEDLSTSLYRS